MRFVVLVLMVGVLIPMSAPAVRADLPTSLDAFTEGLEGCGDPEVAAEQFFKAVYVCTHVDQRLGQGMLGKIMVSDNWDRTMPILVEALKQTPWVFDSYAIGTSPASGYSEIDPQGFRLDVVKVERATDSTLNQGELAAVYLTSSGCPDARPLILRNVDGIFLAANASPLCIGPASTDGNPGLDIAATKDIGNTYHLFMEAIYLYIMGFQSEGEYLLTKTLSQAGFQRDIQTLLQKVREKPYVFYSYALGTSHEDGYVSFDPFAFRINISRKEELTPERVKAWVECSGADTDRPYQCSVTGRGQYRMHEFSTMRVDVRPPAKVEW